MFTSSSAVYALNYQARCLVSQKQSTEKHRFIVGTCSLYDDNEITVLEYREESNSIEALSIYSHRNQIWALESSSLDPSLIVTSHSTIGAQRGVTIWKMPGQSKEDIEQTDIIPNDDKLNLEEMLSFPLWDTQAFVHTVKWHPSKDCILLSDSRTVSSWSLTGSSIEQLCKMPLGSDKYSKEYTGGSAAWDPHSESCCAASFDNNLYIIDNRKNDAISTVLNAHKESIKDIDYNPNKNQMLITAGDDRCIKFWDLRNLKGPVITLNGHSHWVWSAKYNPFHDQLIISGGSDNLVNLWRVASCSSAPWLGNEDTDGNDNNDPPDVKVREIDQHEECVYALAWSPADAWMYCSLSLDGRIILNHVPSTEKYKILL